MPQLIDLTGNTYGRLTVLRRAKNKGRRVAWLCKCECGNTCSVRSSDLVLDKHKSCGCLRLDRITTHGMTGGRKAVNRHPLYSTWLTMKQRCNNPHDNGYHHYGGRGITICKEWNDSFVAFLHDMGDRPSPQHSIDRIDNNKGYFKENCRWATGSEQQLNRRDNHRYDHNGMSLTLPEWSRQTDVPLERLRGRLHLGWSFADALEKPRGFRHHNPRKPCRIDITGQSFGFLTVIEYSHNENQRAYWLCRCQCGTLKAIHGQRLRNGKTKSCGCQRGRPGKPKKRRK